MVYPRMALCLPTRPLLHGASAAAVQMRMMFSHREINWSLNFPPLSTRNFSEEPNTEIHVWNIFYTITSLYLLLITHDALNFVRWSIIWRNHVFEDHSFKSSATVSLKRLAKGKPTMGLGLALLCLKHFTVITNIIDYCN